MDFSIAIVGTGPSGIVFADMVARLYREKNMDNITVHFFEQRDHIGGNTYDYFDKDAQTFVHKYGPHIWHTSSESVMDYMNARGAEFYAYKHRVEALIEGRTVHLPISLATARDLGMKVFPSNVPENATNTEVVLGKLGEMGQKIVIDYSEKQWLVPFDQLDPAIFKRLQLRNDSSPYYFKDRWQLMPVNGFTDMWQSIVEKIPAEIYMHFNDVITEDKMNWLNATFDAVYYTGHVDAFSEHKLEWRNTEIRIEKYDTPWFLSAAVVNTPEPDKPFTRITEFKHFDQHYNSADKTVVMYETPTICEGDDIVKAYPYRTTKTVTMYEKIRKEFAEKYPAVVLGGRLGKYVYIDMDQAVSAAIADAKRFMKGA